MSLAEDCYDDVLLSQEECEEGMTTVEILSIKRETDKAWLMEMERGHGWWLPKSRCVFNERDMTVDIPTWLYNKKLNEQYLEVK